MLGAELSIDLRLDTEEATDLTRFLVSVWVAPSVFACFVPLLGAGERQHRRFQATPFAQLVEFPGESLALGHDSLPA